MLKVAPSATRDESIRDGIDFDGVT